MASGNNPEIAMAPTNPEAQEAPPALEHPQPLIPQWTPPFSVAEARDKLDCEKQDIRDQVMTFRRLIEEHHQPLAVFVGPGISCMAPASQPSWTEFVKKALEETQNLPIPLEDHVVNYIKGLASLVAKKKGITRNPKKKYYLAFDTLYEHLQKDDYLTVIKSVTRNAGVEPNLNHALIARSKLSCVITTCFDGLIEKAFEVDGVEEVQRFTWDRGDIIQAVHSELIKGRCPRFVFNLHGKQAETANIVLRNAQVAGIRARSDIRALIQKIRDGRQCIILGYGYDEDDAKALWDYLDVSASRFIQPLIFVCGKGEVLERQKRTLESRHNVHILEFENSSGDFRFLTYVLLSLLDVTEPLTLEDEFRYKDDLYAPLPHSAEPIDQIMLVVSEATPEKISDLSLFLESLIISIVDPAEPSDLPNLPQTRDELVQRIREHLGYLSQPMLAALEQAITSLATKRMVYFSPLDETIVLDKPALANVRNKAESQRKKFTQAIRAVAARRGKERGIAVSDQDVVNLRDLSNVVLSAQGRTLAEAFISHRATTLGPTFVRAFVQGFCRENRIDGDARSGFYEDVLLTLFLQTPDEYVAVIAQRLQALMLTANYILEPSKGFLMQEYASKHTVYFDSNIVLRALATSLPSHQEAVAVIRRTAQLGMKVKIRNEIFGEVVHQLEAAWRTLGELEKSPGGLGGALAARIAKDGGPENSNLFLGSYSIFRKKSLIEWRPYLQDLFGYSGLGMPGESYVTTFLESKLFMEIDSTDIQNDWKKMWKDDLKNERSRITRKIQAMHAQRSQMPEAEARSLKLSENEAIQFLVIHTLRRRDQAHDKIWFVTNDGYINRLQLDPEESAKYSSVLAYFQVGWQQYLSFLDFDTRSRRRFIDFLESSYYGLAITEPDINHLKRSLESGRKVVDQATLSELIKRQHTQWVKADVTREELERALRAIERLRGGDDQ